MLLAVDVGNTNVKFGVYDKDELKFKMRVATDTRKTGDDFAVSLYSFFQIHGIKPSSISSSVISSVVPKITYPLRSAIKTVTGVNSLVVGPGIKSGLDIKIDHPETLGADIVAGCVGAYEKYGGPYIMIFMGTATAIVYVDENNAYLGGSIAPGVGISLDTLTQKGALLFDVDLKAPKKVVNTNTADCIRSGIMFGTACMLDGMIDKFQDEFETDCKVIATGGLAPLMIKNCRHDIIFDENIILDGLVCINKKNTKPSAHN